MTLVFIDTETTGLDPNRHEVWELAYAIGQGPIHSGVIAHSLRCADPVALRLNGYANRADRLSFNLTVEEECRSALEGATLVAANPAFDAGFLRARWGHTPWHHRLWDVEAYAAGVLGLDSLKGLKGITDTLRELGHDIPEPDHSAAADVATLRASFNALRAIRKDQA